MPYYVYIIQSHKDQHYYKGFSEHPLLRLNQHNQGACVSTRNKTPWELVYVEAFVTKREALIREKALKKYSHSQIQQLAASSKNQLANFLKNSVG